MKRKSLTLLALDRTWYESIFRAADEGVGEVRFIRVRTNAVRKVERPCSLVSAMLNCSAAAVVGNA